MSAPQAGPPVFAIAKKTKRWAWVVWSSRADVHVTGSLLHMPDALAQGVADTAQEAMHRAPA